MTNQEVFKSFLNTQATPAERILTEKIINQMTQKEQQKKEEDK